MNENLRRMSDLKDFRVASDDPDVRGWHVRTREGGEIGEVEELIVDPAARKVRYLEVGLDREGFGLHESRRVSIPVEQAQIDRSGRNVLINTLSREAIGGMPESEYATRGSNTTGRTAGSIDRGRDVTVQRSEEELRVGRHRDQVGEVVVNKHVETERVSEPVTVERDRVRVERRPVEGGDIRGSEARIGDDEVRVPVVEEEVVVEKRPVVKEELVISKETERDVQHVDEELRKERIDVRKEGRVIDESDRTPRRGGDRG
jgi:uncharacterized protein (TIGR02271 family)